MPQIKPMFQLNMWISDAVETVTSEDRDLAQTSKLRLAVKAETETQDFTFL